MKNAFYFTLKALFVLTIFRFLPWHFVTYKNALTRKMRLIPKFITSQPGVNKHENLTWETFLFKNHTQNVVEKLIPGPFQKNQNWLFLRINSPKFYTVCFNFMLIWGLSKYSETKLQTTCFLPYMKLFFNKKKRSKTSFPASFSTWFSKKNISLVIFY